MNTKKIFTWAAVISLGGFLFGLDTAVISGAEQRIQVLWSLDVFEHGLYGVDCPNRYRCRCHVGRYSIG